MAKKVNEERIALIITLTKDSVECRADYEVNAEDLSANRSRTIELTPQQQSAISNFGASVLQQIKQSEDV